MITQIKNWLRSRFSSNPSAPAPAPVAPPLRSLPASSLVPALVGPRALALMMEFEGLDQPWARPPGDSGITIGVGFDLGYCSRAEFAEAWERHLPSADFHALEKVIGLKGRAAEDVKERFRKCQRVTSAAATEVFHRCTLPKWTRAAARIFPGLQVLTPNQQGVLVSLVFNRGDCMTGPRRAEMRVIAALLLSSLNPQVKARNIADQLRGMTRLWPNLPGLRRRRMAEASLMAGG